MIKITPKLLFLTTIAATKTGIEALHDKRGAILGQVAAEKTERFLLDVSSTRCSAG
jgi:hypothetical protein